MQVEVPALEVDLSEFASAHASGAMVVDVRQPYEYQRGHVAGASLIPLGELARRAGEIPAGEEVYVICATGSRSLSAAMHLIGRGHRAVSVRGGTLAWMRSGRPVVMGSDPGERSLGPDA